MWEHWVMKWIWNVRTLRNEMEYEMWIWKIWNDCEYEMNVNARHYENMRMLCMNGIQWVKWNMKCEYGKYEMIVNMKWMWMQGIMKIWECYVWNGMQWVCMQKYEMRCYWNICECKTLRKTELYEMECNEIWNEMVLKQLWMQDIEKYELYEMECNEWEYRDMK